jgi:hypothetical protein
MRLFPLLTGLTLSLVAVPALAIPIPTFPDVDVNQDNVRAIVVLQQAGFFSGYADSTFHPNQSINRAELLKILVASQSDAGALSAADCFPDVHAADWFSAYVCTAVRNGWVSGYPDGRFRPDQPVTLVEALKMLNNVRHYEADGVIVAQGYPRDQWFTSFIDTALSKDIVSLQTVTGTSGDGYDKPLTRTRAAELLYRALLSEGQVHYTFQPTTCSADDVQSVSLKKYDLKTNPDNTVIVDFDIIGKTEAGQDCVIATHANPYATVSRWWNSRTMFLVDANNHDSFKDEVSVTDGVVYLRAGHETAGLTSALWIFNVHTGDFSLAL